MVDQMSHSDAPSAVAEGQGMRAGRTRRLARRVLVALAVVAMAPAAALAIEPLQPDGDGGGLDGSFEMAHGASAAVAAGAMDSDHDGLTDALERR
jgi:hypothetical protein